jgi:hypothetical protein
LLAQAAGAGEAERSAALSLLRSTKNGRDAVALVRTGRPPKGSKDVRRRTARLESIVSSLDKLPKQFSAYKAERTLEAWRLGKGDRGKKLLTRPVVPPVPRSLGRREGKGETDSLLPPHLRDLPPLSEAETARLTQGLAHVPPHLTKALEESRRADKERKEKAAEWKKKRGF